MRRVEPTLSSEDDWYRHYNLDRDPFAEGGVQGLFYPGGARQETVEQLQHLSRFSDCVLLVTGIAGMGKTATRRHFVAQSADFFTALDFRCSIDGVLDAAAGNFVGDFQ
jgi:type II secretory pathway predicted ATPase ExeA